MLIMKKFTLRECHCTKEWYAIVHKSDESNFLFSLSRLEFFLQIFHKRCQLGFYLNSHFFKFNFFLKVGLMRTFCNFYISIGSASGDMETSLRELLEAFSLYKAGQMTP